jgi:hypothetical protein
MIGPNNGGDIGFEAARLAETIKRDFQELGI